MFVLKQKIYFDVSLLSELILKLLGSLVGKYHHTFLSELISKLLGRLVGTRSYLGILNFR